MTGICRAGFAKADLTPGPGVFLAGYAAREGPAKGFRDPLFAHAMVMEDGEQTLAILNLDLLEVTSELTLALRQRIYEVCGIPSDHVFISATHTHSGPLVAEWFGQQPERETIELILASSSQAVQEAQRNLEPVQVLRGNKVVPGIAKDRRSLQESPDTSLQVLGFYAGECLKGCIVNFALHPTILGADNLLYSADYPGYIRSSIAKEHSHCQTLVLNGAAGNINIGYSADASALGEVANFRTFAKAKEVGEALAEKALQALKTGTPMQDFKLKVGQIVSPLALKVLPSLADLEEEIAHLQGIQKIYRECLRDAIKKLAVEGKSELLVELQALRLGETTLLGIPGEPFAEIGLALKEDWPETQVMVVGYTNGYLGYLPTPAIYLEGGYEAETSVFAPTMADGLIRDGRALIASTITQERI